MEQSPLGIEYRAEDFPAGLACSECGRVLREGERYSEVLVGFSEDVPVAQLVCTGCAMTPTT